MRKLLVRPLLLALVLVCSAGLALVAGAGSAAATVTPGVDPASVTQTLLPGASYTLTKTVHTPAIPPKPDIVFLSDTTGSMGGAIANVQANAINVMNTVIGAQPSAEFGVAQYKDFNCDAVPFNIDQPITANTTDVQNGINSWAAGGGCDTPESAINALYELATNPAIAFRSDSSRIIAWFGDEPSHDPSNGHTLADAIAALQAANIKVVAVDVFALDSLGQATAITGATGGVLLPAAGDVSAAILAGLSNLPATVTPVPTCPTGISVTYDASSKTVPSGDDATFSETISVAPGTPAGSYTCSVQFQINGLDAGTAFTQSIAITVPSFAPGGGAFVIGDGSSTVGTQVTFWGAQWWKGNVLSGGAAPASFKGFALNPPAPACGVSWSTDPGNSAPPPAGPLPEYMAVIVASSTTKSGSQISGNTVHIVLVKTDPGYDSNPGHPGTGTVVATLC